LDETSFLAATATHPTLLVTGVLDLDTGRLIDVLPARSANAVTTWLAAKPARWRAGVGHVVIEPHATEVDLQLVARLAVVDAHRRLSTTTPAQHLSDVTLHRTRRHLDPASLQQLGNLHAGQIGRFGSDGGVTAR
jgi:hypothetical protein